MVDVAIIRRSESNVEEETIIWGLNRTRIWLLYHTEAESPLITTYIRGVLV